MSDYINFLVQHRFNSVRLPLSTHWILSNNVVEASQCGEYASMRHLDVLDDVLTRLQSAGIFALLDMHTATYPETNDGLWCSPHAACTAETEASITSAWQTLARRYCSSYPNILGADLFNEPHQATWGVGDEGTRWDLGASRLGNAVLSECPSWLIFVEGVAQHGGWYSSCKPHGCW